MEHPANTVKPVTGCSVKLAVPVSSLLPFAGEIQGGGINVHPLYWFNESNEDFLLCDSSITLQMRSEALPAEVTVPTQR